MTYISIILLAFALSIDACVVSFSYGLAFKEDKERNAFLLSAFTSSFQAIMPVIGYFLTGFIKSYIQQYADLIVFLIFTYLGIKFIKEAFENDKDKNLCLDMKCLILIGIATSIDAFSAGISLSLYGNRIFKPAILIGIITYINSNIGFWAGNKLHKMPTHILEVLAGGLLVALGINAII